MRFVFPAAAIVSLALAVVVTACQKAADAPAPAPAPAAATNGEPPPIPPRTDDAVGDVLDAYDTARLALAHDDADGAKRAAAKVASSAHDGTAPDAKLAEGTRKTLGDLAAAADKMAAAADITAARDAFGDVSKLVVTLVAADPKLQTGRFLFKCPMAKGYQKWVQTTTKLENPFFGKAMLDCGEQLPTWAV